MVGLSLEHLKRFPARTESKAFIAPRSNAMSVRDDGPAAETPSVLMRRKGPRDRQIVLTLGDGATGHPSKRIKDAQSPVDKQSILKILR